MHKSRTKRRIFIVFGLAVIAVAAGGFYFLYFASGLSAPHDDPVFAGDSSELQATEVVVSLRALRVSVREGYPLFESMLRKAGRMESRG